MTHSVHLLLRLFPGQITVFGRRKDGTVWNQVSPTYASSTERARVRIRDSERDPFSLHLSSTWCTHLHSCSISCITLASSNNIQTSLLHNACLLLRQLWLSYSLFNFLPQEYFISNLISELTLWDKGIIIALQMGLQNTIWNICQLFFREYITLYAFKAAFLLLSVAIENAECCTSNKMLNFKYSFNIMFSSFSKIS